MRTDRRLAPLLLLAALIGVTTSAFHRDAAARCFAPEAVPPERRATLGDMRLGNSARDLAAALFDRDLDRAEMLPDRGADPGAIDSGGRNLGTSAFTPPILRNREEDAARKRIQARLETPGLALAAAFPQPNPRAGARSSLASGGS